MREKKRIKIVTNSWIKQIAWKQSLSITLKIPSDSNDKQEPPHARRFQSAASTEISFSGMWIAFANECYQPIAKSRRNIVQLLWAFYHSQNWWKIVRNIFQRNSWNNRTIRLWISNGIQNTKTISVLLIMSNWYPLFWSSLVYIVEMLMGYIRYSRQSLG